MASTPIYNWPTPDNTGLVKNGALDMRTLGNAIDTTMATMTPKSLVDAKGDLIAATANDTPARLAVGNNGETLVADSSTSTGLRYQPNFAAGKNQIINGAFDIWQRGTTITTTGTEGVAYKADRWGTQCDGSTTTRTVSRQAFTPGTAPVAGYEGNYFLRFAQTTAGNNSYNYLGTRIENVTTFAGQTVTFSFWAKADTARTLVSFMTQNFGSGGSGSVSTSNQSNSLTTSWQRFSQTVTLASIAGKTIGTSSFLEAIFQLPSGNITPTIDIWGVQLEASNTATAFQTATGNIQQELAACQRYYWRNTAASNNVPYGGGYNESTTISDFYIQFPQTMRTSPSAVEYSTLQVSDFATFGTDITNLVISASTNGPAGIILTSTVASGLTAQRVSFLRAKTAGTSYLGFSAEL